MPFNNFDVKYNQPLLYDVCNHATYPSILWTCYENTANAPSSPASILVLPRSNPVNVHVMKYNYQEYLNLLYDGYFEIRPDILHNGENNLNLAINCIKNLLMIAKNEHNQSSCPTNVSEKTLACGCTKTHIQTNVKEKSISANDNLVNLQPSHLEEFYPILLDNNLKQYLKVRLLEVSYQLTKACENDDVNDLMRIVNKYEILCKTTSNVSIVNFRTSRGETPLTIACSRGNVKAVKWLLAQISTDINKMSSEGMSLLLTACAYSRANITSLLLNNTRWINVNAVDERKFTALHYVIAHSKNGGRTLLHNACENSDYETVKRLLYNHTKRWEVNVQDNDGWTPLHLACFMGNIEIVALLLWAGADVSVTDEDDNTPEEVAKMVNSDYLVDVLNLRSITEWWPTYFHFYTELMNYDSYFNEE